MAISDKTIAITGAAGALGRYGCLFFQHVAGSRIVPIVRSDFAGGPELAAKVRSDVVLHFAGVNRGTDDDVRSGNIEIANKLVWALETAEATPHVIYASSIHERHDTVYGRSKREAGDIVQKWAERNGARFTRLLLPHLYSELVKPEYNSGIATFCRRVARGAAAEVIVDAEIHPIHAYEVCTLIENVIAEGLGRDTAPLGRSWRMSEILSELQAFHESYIGQQIVPDLRDADKLRLFNTYRAHLDEDVFPIFPIVHSDNRGSLVELAKELNGGQSFISTTLPGITRGNHFHFHKVERFCVLRGDAKISMRNMATHDVRSFNVSGAKPCFIDIPTLWAHNITNIGDSELLTFFWAQEIFNRTATDTYPAIV